VKGEPDTYQCGTCHHNVQAGNTLDEIQRALPASTKYNIGAHNYHAKDDKKTAHPTLDMVFGITTEEFLSSGEDRKDSDLLLR
jgi:hypothetical protein